MTQNTRPIALITGASRGIGRAIAEELANTHHLLIGGTNPSSVDRVVAKLPSAEPFVAELTDAEALARACAGIDHLDVLVHSAGVGGGDEVGATDIEEWRRVFEVNVFAVAELTRLLLPALRERHGQIIMINSGSGYNAGPGGAVYAGSKFALRAMTNALREELRGQVRVTAIHPGRVDTDMQVELQARSGNTDYDGSIYIRPESVARTVRTAIEVSPEAMIEELSIRPVVK